MLYSRGVLTSPRRSRQRGQALIFVTVTALAMILALLVMFNMGQVTTEKMRLQNTADAAAYSSALAQARDYNFSAYLNRGMIANDAAVAQLVGLASWGRNYYDTFNRLTTGVDPMWPEITPGPMYSMWTVTHGIAQVASKGLKPVFERSAAIFVPTLLTLNELFIDGQKIYHYGTALTVAQTLGVFDKFEDEVKKISGFEIPGFNYLSEGGSSSNVIAQNDPAAQLSTLGLANYLYNTQQWYGFTKTLNPLGPWGSETEDNSERVRYCDNGDGFFGSDWICKLPNSLGGHSWSYRIDKTHENDTYTYPDDGTFDGPKKDRMAGVVMASTDDFTKDRSKNWTLPLLTDVALVAGPESMGSSWFLKMLFHNGATAFATDKEDNNIWTGGAKRRKVDSWNHRWVANDSSNMLAISTCPIPIPFYGFINIPCLPYVSGGGFGLPLGQDATGTASAGWQNGEFSTKTALRAYRDVSHYDPAKPDYQSLSSPPLVVEVEKPITSIAVSSSLGGGAGQPGNLGIGRAGTVGDPSECDGERNVKAITTVFAPNNLDLGQTTNSNCMRALAKAEAYFSRPHSLFPRADKKIEYGSLYSPYWQARLVPNNAFEQISSILAQKVF